MHIISTVALCQVTHVPGRPTSGKCTHPLLLQRLLFALEPTRYMRCLATVDARVLVADSLLPLGRQDNVVLCASLTSIAVCTTWLSLIECTPSSCGDGQCARGCGGAA